MLKKEAWQKIVAFPLGKREAKPREKGLSMIIDKGLGLRELQDLLEVASAYLDFLKLGFGTSLLYKESLLKAKIKLCQKYQVEIYPGGTLTEIAIKQGRYEAYLTRAQKLGFKTIEISDGTIFLNPQERKCCIKQAVNAGFTVLSELGKKNPKVSPSLTQLRKQGQKDLTDGAWKIIIEARESGKGMGIYNNKGEIKETKLADLLNDNINPNQVIWEAPLKNQQSGLIKKLGTTVNLGNIQPQDLLALEALRTGLRADTWEVKNES